jgi:predicted glycosyltransferase involved in capsule biosynthesis
MALISAITTCKGRLAHLKQSLPALMATGMEVIVVDYDCPDHAGEWVTATWPQARVVSVSDRPRFNLSAARNLGAAVASHEWLVFLDADVIVAPSFMTVVEPLLRGGVFLIPEPRPPDLWGAIAVARRHFDAVGGYDEVFEGWGVEDVDFIERLLIGGLQQAPFPGELLRAIEHGETERTRFHEMTAS